MIKVHSDVAYVVFDDTQADHWFLRWLAPKRKHCYYVKKSIGKQFWIVTNNGKSHLSVDIESVSTYPTVRSLVGDADYLVVPIDIDENQNRHTICLITCVEICKAALGIRDFWCWTPSQLYKRLKKVAL